MCKKLHIVRIRFNFSNPFEVVSNFSQNIPELYYHFLITERCCSFLVSRQCQDLYIDLYFYRMSLLLLSSDQFSSKKTSSYVLKISFWNIWKINLLTIYFTLIFYLEFFFLLYGLNNLLPVQVFTKFYSSFTSVIESIALISSW